MDSVPALASAWGRGPRLDGTPCGPFIVKQKCWVDRGKGNEKRSHTVRGQAPIAELRGHTSDLNTRDKT